MTITISEHVAPSTLERLFKYMRREKIPFVLQPDVQNETENDLVRTAAIRERLRVKYVLNGEWSTMDDEERQDAALLEGILYNKDNPTMKCIQKLIQKPFTIP
jgi:CO dehydrogenase/acetyl-CoA synthase epsilon subunit